MYIVEVQNWRKMWYRRYIGLSTVLHSSDFVTGIKISASVKLFKSNRLFCFEGNVYVYTYITCLEIWHIAMKMR